MEPIELSRLRERLLRAGVAPRHVHRYVRELRDHHEDLVDSELARGCERSAAEAAASARLGSVEELAQSVLARPELRSIASRFPALAFGAGPALAWAMFVIATALLIRGAGDRIAAALGLSASGMLAATHAVVLVHLRAVPVLLSVAIAVASHRQRSKLTWPLVGTAIVCLVAGTFRIEVFGAQLGVSSALLPYIAPLRDVFGPTSLEALANGLLRAALMLAAAWLPRVVTARRHAPTTE